MNTSATPRTNATEDVDTATPTRAKGEFFVRVVDESRDIPAIEALTEFEELHYHQLAQEQFWFKRTSTARSDRGIEATRASADLPDKWELTKGITLHDWQKSCVNAWFVNGNRGIIKVVTGAGKTLLALGIAERLQREAVPNLHVAIVVPTIVLLDQWYEELVARSNLPQESIGRLGGGYADSFDERIRVLICVLNSASTKLPDNVNESGVSDDLLLVVDECHRAGAAEMRRIFQTNRRHSLGLSATPERDDDASMDLDSDMYRTEEFIQPRGFDSTVLGRELGPVIFEMNYAEAIARGVLPPFRVVHYGLSLRPKERERYEHMSREISDLRSELESRGRRGLELIRWCRSRAAAGDPKAARFVSLTSERKRLLFRMSERGAAVTEILRNALAQAPSYKAILFHESINEVMAIFHVLRKAGYSVVAEHSEFPDAMRAESLRLFRNGTAKIIVSARSLIEGFNVPSADIGIVVAASSSVRQRVQTLGRLLRKNQAPGGHEKQAVLYVLYAHESVDEMIYEKADWAQFVGADRNEYFLWRSVGESDPLPQSRPPRVPQADEESVDASALKPGDVYPGNPDQGKSYSIDTQGTVRDEDGNLMKPNAQLKAVLSGYQNSLGRFRVTPKKQFVIKLEKGPEGWHGTYLGQLKVPLEAGDYGETRPTYSPGDTYPLGRVKGRTFSVLQRDPRLIARKSRADVHFVRPLAEIADADKRKKLETLQERLKLVYSSGHHVNRLTVTPEGHVVYVFDGVAYYLGEAPEGAEGFAFESP